MKYLVLFSFVSVILFTSCEMPKKQPSVSVSFSDVIGETPLDGRLLLMFSSNDEREPRFQINAGVNAQLIFGMDVEGMQAGQDVVFDETIFGFPYESLADVPAGE